MGRRVFVGMLAGGVYVWLMWLAFHFTNRMRDHATEQFSSRPMVFGILALLGAGILTALVTLHGRRLPALIWTAGIASLMLIPQWSFVPWLPGPVRRWVMEWSFGLESTSLLAGLLLTLAVHATWLTESPGSASTETRGARLLNR